MRAVLGVVGWCSKDLPLGGRDAIANEIFGVLREEFHAILIFS